MNDTFQTNRNAVLNALNECGVGEDLDRRLNTVAEELEERDPPVNLQRAYKQTVRN